MSSVKVRESVPSSNKMWISSEGTQSLKGDEALYQGTAVLWCLQDVSGSGLQEQLLLWEHVLYGKYTKLMFLDHCTI